MKPGLARMPICEIVGMRHSLLEKILVDDLHQVLASRGKRVQNDYLSFFCKKLNDELGKFEAWGFAEKKRRDYVHSFDCGTKFIIVETDVCQGYPDKIPDPTSFIRLRRLDNNRLLDLLVRYGHDIPISEYTEVAMRSPGTLGVKEKNPALVSIYLLRLLEPGKLSGAAIQAVNLAFRILKRWKEAPIDSINESIASFNAWKN